MFAVIDLVSDRSCRFFIDRFILFQNLIDVGFINMYDILIFFIACALGANDSLDEDRWFSFALILLDTFRSIIVAFFLFCLRLHLLLDPCLV